jgi:hypothetical protein
MPGPEDIMGNSRRFRFAALAALVVSAGAALAADTLYLRNGREVSGRLVSVRGDRIEFEEHRGWGSPRLVQFDRDEVRSIEFDRRGWGGPGGGPGSGGGPGGGRPGGMREREVVVSADVPWNDAGVEVRSGQQVYFDARGQVRWGRDRRDGPEGERNSPHNPARPIPNRPGAALIGKIGPNGDPFFIGADAGPFRMRSSGRLFLGINDDYLADNSGNFRVIVSY